MSQEETPEFYPPEEEGMTVMLYDDDDNLVELEFLGMIVHEDRRFGFFFPVTEEEPVGSSGEIFMLEVVELDEDGQPATFEVVEDDDLAQEVYEEFQEATKDIYEFE